MKAQRLKPKIPICSPHILAQNIPFFPRGGQAKICGTYADLVGTEKAEMQIFSMVLQIFSMMH